MTVLPATVLSVSTCCIEPFILTCDAGTTFNSIHQVCSIPMRVTESLGREGTPTTGASETMSSRILHGSAWIEM